MDADKFMHDAGRMCESNEDCLTCKSVDCCSPNIWRNAEKRSKFIDDVKQWVKDNPEKTMLQDFLEKFPKAILDDRGLPKNICPYHVGYVSKALCATGHSDCVKCWTRPLEG